MSAYTTRDITREEAERMLREIKAKGWRFGGWSDEELERELHDHTYNGGHEDILGVLTNFRIKK